MRWTLELPLPAACCIVLLLGLSVMLLPVCGPMVCTHPCCPDHEPHCTVSADLANACPVQAHVKTAATHAQNQQIPASPVFAVRAWSDASARAGAALVSTQAGPPARSASVPLRI